jgi:hypothetical protein
MSKQEERSRQVVQWLEHLHSWKESGESLSAYARGHGLALWAMYHWRSVLIREGHWREKRAEVVKAHVARKASAVPLRFARVAVTDSPRPVPLIVRVQLGNARRAEIEVGELAQLGEIIAVLERQV